MSVLVKNCGFMGFCSNKWIQIWVAVVEAVHPAAFDFLEDGATIGPIELFSFLSRPLSIALRLAANITSGHILLHVISSFIVACWASHSIASWVFLQCHLYSP